MPPYWLTTLQSSMISSVDVMDPGGYTKPVLIPKAPASNSLLMIFFIEFNSSGVAVPSSNPNTLALIFPWGIKNAKFVEIQDARHAVPIEKPEEFNDTVMKFLLEQS